MTRLHQSTSDTLHARRVLRHEAPPHAPRTVTVRPMTPDDLQFVSREHVRSLPDGLYAKLGPAFLRRYYRSFLRDGSCIALIAEVAGRPAGFVAGAVGDAAHRRHARRSAPALLAAAVRAAVRRPGMVWPVVRSATGRLRRRAAGASGSAPAPTTAVLSFLAVSRATRHHGVGTELVTAFLRSAQQRGAGRVTLATKAGPGGAQRFYAQLGWVAGDIRAGVGEPLRVMSWTFAPDGFAP